MKSTSAPHNESASQSRDSSLRATAKSACRKNVSDHQEFFAQLISKHHLRLADRNKGKFRTFLLAGLDFFLAREWSRAHRQKRGGQFTFISLDQQTPEESYRFGACG